MVLNSGRAKEGKRGLSGPNEWVKSTQLNDFNFSTTSPTDCDFEILDVNFVFADVVVVITKILLIFV